MSFPTSFIRSTTAYVTNPTGMIDVPSLCFNFDRCTSKKLSFTVQSSSGPDRIASTKHATEDTRCEKQAERDRRKYRQS